MYYTKFCASILLLAILLFSVGCSGQDGAGKPTMKQMEPGGQLTYGSLQEPSTLNPLQSDLLATAEVGSLIFSGLVVANDKGEWIPDLAVDVPTRQNGGVSPDGLTVTYRLRPGVTWHDGMPFTSADVKFTWETIMNQNFRDANRNGYDKISGVDTPDDTTVIIHFREYYAPYLTLFPTIIPKHILDKEGDINKAAFNRAPIGTGPFKFKEWRIADSILLEANPNYFRG